jgi:hypothetical protein
VKSRVAIPRINGSRRSEQGHVAQGSLGVGVQRIGIREFGILEVIGTGQRKSRNPEVTWHVRPRWRSGGQLSEIYCRIGDRHIGDSVVVKTLHRKLANPENPMGCYLTEVISEVVVWTKGHSQGG